MNITRLFTSFALHGFMLYFASCGYDSFTLFQRAKQVSRRFVCSVATESLPKQVEESNMDMPKEIFLKDYKLPDYYFDKV